MKDRVNHCVPPCACEMRLNDIIRLEPLGKEGKIEGKVKEVESNGKKDTEKNAKKINEIPQARVERATFR